MKKLYVTYVDNGIVKKGELSEERFHALQASGKITEVQVHSNKSLMEKKFGELLCPGGKCDNRNFLLS